MEFSLETMIGYGGAFCTTISFLPQVIKVLKEKDLSAISLGMYSLFTFGVFLWCCYGLMKNDPVIILANGITLLLASIILLMKVRSLLEQKP